MTPTFDLTPKQRDHRKLLGGPETHCLLYGGSRSGKTFLFCYAIATRALRAPGSRHLIARFRLKHVVASVARDTFPKMMRLAYPGVPYAENKSDWFVTLPGGSEIWYGGLDDKERVDKILGLEFATIYVNECSQVSYPAIITLRSRLAQSVIDPMTARDLKLKAYYDLNPVGKSHWSYREFVEGKDPNSDTALRPGERCWGAINPLDNPHLAEQYLRILEDMPARQRQRFLEGKFLNEVPGALWKLDTLEKHRVDEPPCAMRRIVVAIDPNTKKPDEGVAWDIAECGIVVAGLGEDGRGYVLSDLSERIGPDAWAKKAVGAYHGFRADRIIAEQNAGGEMVRITLQTADPLVPVDLVHASRGKITRAEPISALYEQGKISHCGRFAELEDQMTSYTGAPGEVSPDRMDALVWALTALFFGAAAQPNIRSLV